MKRKLNKTAVKMAKPEENRKSQKFFDGGGLYLLVNWITDRHDPKQRSLAKYWRYKYHFAGKEKLYAIGHYPDLSLDDARDIHMQLRALLAKGIDPAQWKRDQEAERRRVANNSFEKLTRLWFEGYKNTVSEATAKRNIRRLEVYAFNRFGKRAVDTIRPREILEHLDTIKGTTRGGTRDKVKVLIGQVFDYAVLHEYCSQNPVRLLGRNAIQYTPTKPHASITSPDEVGEFWYKVNHALDGSFEAKHALKLTALVFLRASELAGAEWSEIDLDDARWTVPATRLKLTKQGKADPNNNRTIYLSRQAVQIFQDLYPVTGNRQHVFASPMNRKKPIVPDSIRKGIRRLGYGNDDLTSHGLRATAKP